MKPRRAPIEDASPGLHPPQVADLPSIDQGRIPPTLLPRPDAGIALFAELPTALRREDPDAFRRKEEEIRALFCQRHPGEGLLRQETSDRQKVRYLREGVDPPTDTVKPRATG